MRWHVFGASLSTGEDIELMLEAADELSAEIKANSLGIAVERVERACEQANIAPQPQARRLPTLSDEEAIPTINIDKALRTLAHKKSEHTSILRAVLVVLIVIAVVIGLPAYIGYTYTVNSFEDDKPSLFDHALSSPRHAEPMVTMSEFLRIHDGMSYSEVVAVIGHSGTESARSVMDGIPGVMDRHEIVIYGWMNGDGGNMSATFENNKLTMKVQFGLP